MDTASLTEITLNFLKKYCHLDEPGRPITFVDGYTRQIDPVVVQRMRAQDRSWVPETRGNRVVDDYQAMQSFSPMNHFDVNHYFESFVRGRNIVVVDIGGEMGALYMRRVANENRHTQFYLIDKLGRDHVIDEVECQTGQDPDPLLIKSAVPEQQDIAAWINQIFKASGWHNLHYVHCQAEVSTSSNLESLINKVRGKRIFVRANRVPKLLSLISVYEMYYLNAESGMIAPSALEWLDPERARVYLGDFLKPYLAEQEEARFLEIVYDPHTKTDSRKFDYRKPGHEQIGTALKQVFVLRLASILEKGYQVSISLRTPNYNEFDHNQPSHIIFAQRIS